MAKRNMVGTNTSMGIMVYKLRKMNMLKENTEVKKSSNVMQVKQFVIIVAKKFKLLRVASNL